MLTNSMYRIEYIKMYGLRYRQLLQQLKHIYFVIFIISIALGGCSKKLEPVNKINICVSILPLAEFTEKIGGDLVQVSVMVPAGITPHSYEPTVEQLTDLNSTDIYIKVGTPIEFELAWLDKILSINKNIILCNASENIAPPELDIDPHIWLSPLNAQIMVENIYEVLIEVDAKNTAFYSRNKQNYIKELVELNERIQMLFNDKKNRKFLVYHPAWGHFARTYNLEQISIEKEGKEPTAKGILNIIEQAKKDDIHLIFAAPQMSTKSAQVIAREIQGKVIMIDPLEKNYILNLMNVAEQLSRSMD
jgi:zinc transport system substrate-binding protein